MLPGGCSGKIMVCIMVGWSLVTGNGISTSLWLNVRSWIYCTLFLYLVIEVINIKIKPML